MLFVDCGLMCVGCWLLFAGGCSLVVVCSVMLVLLLVVCCVSFVVCVRVVRCVCLLFGVWSSLLLLVVVCYCLLLDDAC